MWDIVERLPNLTGGSVWEWVDQGGRSAITATTATVTRSASILLRTVASR